jgi:hypothetical protein
VNAEISIVEVLTYLEITTSKLSVWEKREDETCTKYLFSSSYSATSTNLTINNTDGGQIAVNYSVDGDNMTVIVPGVEDNKLIYDTLIFSKQFFNPSIDFLPYCLSGLWTFISNDSIYIEIEENEEVFEVNYQKWKNTGTCYNFETSGLVNINYTQNSGTFNNYNQGSTADIYYNGNDTLIINPEVSQQLTSQLEIAPVVTYEPDTCIRVSNKFIDFEDNGCVGQD